MKKLFFTWFLIVTLFAFVAASVQSLMEISHLRTDADARAFTLLSSLDDAVLTAYHTGKTGRIAKIIDRLRNSPRSSEGVSAIAGLAICPMGEKSPLSFPLGENWNRLCAQSFVLKASQSQQDQTLSMTFRAKPLKYYARALTPPSRQGSDVMVLVQDLSPLRQRLIESFARGFIVYWLSSLVVALLVATQLRKWFQRNLKLLRQSLRSLISGRQPHYLKSSDGDHAGRLQPINRDLHELAQKIFSLSTRLAARGAARKAGEQTASKPSWLTELKQVLKDRTLVVIANREPYIHQKTSKGIEVLRPASGLVTALEPVLRQSGGVWIAHGSGSADREMSDAAGVVGVPPGGEKYKLKRVWLSPEEEAGYYYGFANEGIWPLCHLAHTRPTFRLTDWSYYTEVNRKFSEAIPTNNLNENSVILVQDYHFALLPRLIREREKSSIRPAKIGLFWHIPWPNPEAFGICPWNTELLRGMLGADVVGFHTQYHCNNFLETCNRYLEARIDYERFSVTMENHETRVRAFPIGIDTSEVRTLSTNQITELKREYGITAEKVAVGVDRLDYTKGLVERVEAVERFLEKSPQWIGKFSFVQMGSASRTQIPAYQTLSHQLQEAIERVNLRFSVESMPDYKPVILLSHHSWEEIKYFYQIGDVCLVTSLHDGMNLVAKEYVWCQSAERGALILSKFAGASRELTEAFIINPYSIEEMADAISASLTLTIEERVARMQAMKAKVAGRNAFHWAADLIKAVVASDDPVIQTPPQTLPVEIGSRPSELPRKLSSVI